MQKMFEAPEDEKSTGQKIQDGLGTLLYAIRPPALYVCLPVLVMMIGMILMMGRTTENPDVDSSNFYYALGMILTVLVLHGRSKKRGSSLWEDAALDVKAPDSRKILLLLLTGLGFGFFFSALLSVVPFPEFLMDSYRSSSGGLSEDTNQIPALICTAILAPVTEEIVFRGYMFNRLERRFNEKYCILISSALFAVCHVSFLWILYAFAMGLLLANVSKNEGNIVYSIALHMGFNSNVIPVWIINRIPALEEIMFANDMLIAVYGMIACFCAVQMYRKYRSCNSRR